MSEQEEAVKIAHGFIPNKYDLIKIGAYFFVFVFVFSIGWMLHQTATGNYLCKVQLSNSWFSLNMSYWANTTGYKVVNYSIDTVHTMNGMPIIESMPFDNPAYNKTNFVQDILGK